MNKFIKKLAAVGAAAVVALSALTAQAEISREHRAIWASAYLNGNWPSAAITSSNAESLKSILRNRLSAIASQNINVIYYHVRSHCDAMYNSAYEPWSAQASGTRGVAPAFDPFAFFIETAHANGIEVYAWVNPYRYHSYDGGTYGSNPLNYENSHPDWLIDGDPASNSAQRVLNPGLEAVKQRVVDVCKDIITKYDVDGVVFDDYFYSQGGTPMTEDATQYNAYISAGGTLSQADWRRANVNEMVRRVGEMIYATKPYLRFGISPAGYASPPTVESEYGLEPCGGGTTDWQYGTIYSDPLNWLKNQYIDYISPQIYVSSLKFDVLDPWWANAAKKFGRHHYASQGLDALSSLKSAEFIQEMLIAREGAPENAAGVVYFEWNQFVNHAEARVKFGDIMKDAVFQTKALMPIMPWRNKIESKMVSNVKLNGTSLTWNAVSGMRYTVYAVPTSVSDAEFGCQREYLQAVTYTNSYTIPNAMTSGYRWAVCVYDRYGNEYSPLFAGATAKTASAVTLSAPTNGSTAPDLFRFKWSGEGTRFYVDVAEDASFSKMVGSIETTSKSASVAQIPAATLTPGKKYYWRVRSMVVNAPMTTSATNSFVASRVSVTSPANNGTDVSLTPTITWTAAEQGSKYLLEVASLSDFSVVVYSKETTATSAAVPTLASYNTFYARVTATLDGCTSTSEPVAFKTIEKTYTDNPTIARPATNGATLYSNQTVSVNPWSGYKQVKIMISESSSFPARNSKTITLTNGACESKELGTYSLKNGTTYYVRAHGEYSVSSTTTLQKTAYSPVLTFVYNEGTGIEGVENDAAEVYVHNDILVVNADAQVQIYTIAGQMVENVAVEGMYDLSHLAHGVYVIKVVTDEATTLKYVR
ncbi:MAG: family 10 glycosylhydrolase [Muribaculaceae bacterium]|nr:family 10 glycosylhydrolase [Muribaculaceae bacterium]